MNSVANAIRILLLLHSHGPLGVIDLSARLGIGKSTVHRLLSTLRSFDFVEQEPRGRKYRIGVGFSEIVVSHSPETRLMAAARRELERLADATGETTNLIVLRGPDAVFVDGVEGAQALRIATRTGDRIPAYSSAGGKLLLADLPLEDIHLLYPGLLAALTSRTVTERQVLVDRLAAIRKQGYATSNSECIEGVAAVAVGVIDLPQKVVAAITVSVPSSRFSKPLADHLVETLRAAARRISRNLTTSAGVVVPPQEWP